MRVARDAAPFVGAGFRPREFFPHEVAWLPKPYPDTYLDLERRGLSRAEALRGTCVQLNLYSDHLGGLPDALFTDPAVNWHGQQLGRRGLIAAAGLFLCDDAAFVTLLQSDLCQQVYRSAELKRAASARLNNRFRYWHLLLVNAVLDFAADRGLDAVLVPTAAQIVATIRRRVEPELFHRIYDSTAMRYRCTQEQVGAATYWRVPLAPNRARVARLAEGDGAPALPSRRVICIVHDTEEDVDTPVSPADCKQALGRMLEIEQARGVSTTYAVLGRLFAEKAPIIRAHGAHALAFHSFDHRIDDHTQLARVREVDLQIKGYRPPRSVLTPELSDHALAYWNFEWLASSAHSLGFATPRVENGLVKILVLTDDYALHTGEDTWPAWSVRLLARVEEQDVVAVGLHDCYAAHWLDHYPELLDRLQALGDLHTCEQVVDRLRWESALAAAHGGARQSPSGARSSR